MDRQTAAQIIEGYMKPVYGFALRRCASPQDAEDLAQEICLKLYRSLSSRDDIASTDAFVWTVARHALANYYRGRQRAGVGLPLDDLLEPLPAGRDACAPLLQAEEEKALHRAIAYLSDIQRRVVAAYYFENKRQETIAAQLEKIDIFTGVKRMAFDDAVKAGLITLLGEETDKMFMSNVMAMINDRASVAQVADSFKVVYTPFHGCGWKLVPEALRGLGVKNLYCVEQQMVLDGTFPTVASPNPENPEGFYLAIELADKVGADFILGTDPDSDRVGIMVRGADGKFIAVTGNQTGVLLLDYLIGAMRRAGKMPEHPYFLKTIVTTEMARKVAESNDVTCCDTFTGFKFMAEKKNALEAAGEGHVIMSYEESYGYMLGDYVRDKDAVTASLLITEMAAWYAAKGMTLYDALQALYKKYGWYGEKTHNLVMPGLDGLEKMAALMERLRTAPPANIAGVDVVVRKDYQDGSAVDCATGNVGKMELSGSNVLRFELADGTTILVRPSGTEPKIKVYILTKGVDAAERDANIEKYSAWVKTLTE